MYGFTEANAVATEGISSVALTFDGTNVDQEVKGYQTLNVYGREGADVEVITEQIDDGVIEVKHVLTTKPIVVEYMISTETDAEYEEAFEKLMRILFTDEHVKFSFADSEAVFFGRMTTFDNVENRNNTVVGKFELFREKPFKYTETITTGGSTPVTDRKLEIEWMKLTVTTNVNEIEVTNGRQTVRIVEPVATTDTVEMNFKTGKVTKNGENFAYGLALNSDFENFEIKSGDTITSPQANVEVGIRERWL